MCLFIYVFTHLFILSADNALNTKPWRIKDENCPHDFTVFLEKPKSTIKGSKYQAIRMELPMEFSLEDASPHVGYQRGFI